LARRGRLYVGDCKMAAREMRAPIAAAGAFYVCPLPQVPLAEGEREAALECVGRGEPALTAVVRANTQGESEVIAEGYESPRAMSHRTEEQGPSWTERRLVVRPLRPARAAEAALRGRVAEALAQIEALNRRGRGHKRFATIAA
jgi:hypothetical protein